MKIEQIYFDGPAMSMQNNLSKLDAKVSYFEKLSPIDKRMNGQKLNRQMHLIELINVMEKTYLANRNIVAELLSELNANRVPGLYPVAPKGERIDLLDNGHIQITIPQMLPLKDTVYAHFLPKKLEYLLHELQESYLSEEKDMPCFTKLAVVFVHYYSDTVRSFPVDYDNLERKSVLDLLRRYFFYSDNCLHLTSSDFTIPSDNPRTEIFLMPNEDFPKFIAEFWNPEIERK